MRFNNKTNIPNKIIQSVVNSMNDLDDSGLNIRTPSFSFQDAYGVVTTTYKVNIEGFPTIIVKDVDHKYYDITTTGNEKFYNIDKDGKKITSPNKKEGK